MNKNLSKKNNSTQKSVIRIIGGSWRSRKLPVLDAKGLRPTTDKMRETVFNWLAPYIHSARVLDLFAGTGALGLESLSRGAVKAHFCELSTPAATQLKRNISTLKCKGATVYNASALDFLERPAEAFDIVFIDPPFDQDLWPSALQKLSAGWLASGAILYIETPADYVLSMPNDNSHTVVNWRILKEKKMGQVRAQLIEVNHTV